MTAGLRKETIRHCLKAEQSSQGSFNMNKTSLLCHLFVILLLLQKKNYNKGDEIAPVLKQQVLKMCREVEVQPHINYYGVGWSPSHSATLHTSFRKELPYLITRKLDGFQGQSQTDSEEKCSCPYPRIKLW
jgi:hypothetical protein